MFKFMKKSDLDHLQGQIEEIGSKLSACQNELDSAYAEIEKTEKVNEDLRETIESMESSLEEMQHIQDESIHADSNVVELEIANDLTTVTPTVRFRRDVFEKMVELGYLSDKDQNNDMAIQVALMTITHEALQQIIDSFSEPVED